MKVQGGKETWSGVLDDPASAAGSRRKYRPERPRSAGLSAKNPVLNALGSYWRFLVAGLLNHTQTGAVVPSQRFLISQMIAPVPVGYRGHIIELGPGTGVLTRRLAARCPRARILACEINPALARDLEYSLATAGLTRRVDVIAGSAEHFLRNLRREGIAPPEFIISGIPLGNLDRKTVMDIVGAVHDALAPGGMYIQFQHSLLDRKKIKAQFGRLRTAPAFLNFPPAFVYYARK